LNAERNDLFSALVVKRAGIFDLAFAIPWWPTGLASMIKNAPLTGGDGSRAKPLSILWRGCNQRVIAFNFGDNNRVAGSGQ
jgi:hypothetical protein